MSTGHALQPDQAHAIWDLLVARAGACEDDRDTFVGYLTRDHRFGHEWRFGGSLGSGGKLYSNRARGAYVGCYGEDRTPEREALIGDLNAKLLDIAGPVGPDLMAKLAKSLRRGA